MPYADDFFQKKKTLNQKSLTKNKVLLEGSLLTHRKIFN